MPSLLIADRDPTERAGLSWLVSSCAIPYDKVHSAGTTAELFQAMESHTPEVVYIELDMIDKAHWERLKLLVAQYRPTVLVTTSEATFERAMQGIELSARDLWLKPQTPEYIRRVLTRSCQERAGDARIDQGPGASRDGAGRFRTATCFCRGSRRSADIRSCSRSWKTRKTPGAVAFSRTIRFATSQCCCRQVTRLSPSFPRRRRLPGRSGTSLASGC